MQNIPSSAGKHLGFTWGPGDILVYETLYKSSGMCRIIEDIYFYVSCLISALHETVFKESWVQDLPSSMKSGKMKTFIHQFYANFSMSHITSLSGCRQSEKNFPARTKKLSKLKVSDVNIVCRGESIAQFITSSVSSSGLSASVKTTGLLFEPVWKNFNKLQVGRLGFALYLRF